MNGPEHYAAAERHLRGAEDMYKDGQPPLLVGARSSLAQVHATLALAAAQAGQTLGMPGVPSAEWSGHAMTAALATALVLACIALGIVVSKWRAVVRERDAAEAAAEREARILAEKAWAVARDAQTAQRVTEKLATKSAQEAARLRQRLLLQAPRVFPAAPRPGANLRVVPEGESPIYDALTTTAKPAAKRAARTSQPTPIAKKRGGGKAVRSS